MLGRVGIAYTAAPLLMIIYLA